MAYQTGQEVRHPKRPEWGTGVVRSVEPITHHGVQAQRVAVDFANKGRVVVNTAIASLEITGNAEPAAAGTRVSPRKLPSRLTTQQEAGQKGSVRPGDAGWLNELERGGGATSSGDLWSLPSSMTDPFASLKQRLLATLDSYRFTTDPRSLIEWAVVQTGLDDPLSKYTRSELERAFPRFSRDRDNHLAELIRTIKRQMQHVILDEVRAEIELPAAHKALHKTSRSV
ncbi:DUF3553 domain-containing protein [Mucisphaera calidilacus]|nr:DUF3553 domain-containing protein [Mucisphaera calidilacus]